jgi:hypothetical protein
LLLVVLLKRWECNMRVKEEVKEMECFTINEDRKAYCVKKDNFYKLMVMYQHNKPVWAHRDCLVQKSEKVEKKDLTKRKKKV